MLRPHTYSGGMLRALGRGAIAADGFIYGLTKPDATNTGVPAGATLTTHTGSYSLTTANQTYTRVRFTQRVGVNAPGLKFIECRFEEPNDTLAFCGSVAKDILFQRCTFRPSGTSTNTIAVAGHDYTIDRCDISGSVDGLRVHNTNVVDGPSGVTIRGSYIHDLCFTTPYSGHSDNETHNDGIQLEGGNDTLIWGNSIAAFGDPILGNIADNPRGPQVLSCIIVTPNVGNVRRLRIVANWFSGAYVPINIAEKGRGPLSDLMILDNRFAGDKRLSWDVLLEWTTKAAVDLSKWTGNTRTDTGQPVVFSG